MNDNICSFKENDRLLIELCSNRKFECNFVSSARRGITVVNIVDVGTGKARKNKQQFYYAEIKSIFVLSSTSTSSDQNGNSVSGGKPLEKVSIDAKIKAHFQKLLTNITVISQCDSKYFEAIENLRNEEHIGLCTQYMFGRLSNTRPLICMCTSNAIYIFDFLQSIGMPKELTNILTSETPRKIIFDSELLADYLKHAEDCKLNGIIDVLVFYSMVKRKKCSISFEDCIDEFFVINDFWGTEDVFAINYQLRPLPDVGIMSIAKNVFMVVKLFWHLLHNILLRPLTDGSMKFMNAFTGLRNNTDVLSHINNSIRPGIDDINVTELDHLRDANKIFENPEPQVNEVCDSDTEMN